MSGFWQSIVDSLGSSFESNDAEDDTPIPFELVGGESEGGTSKKRRYTGATRYSFGGRSEEFAQLQQQTTESILAWREVLPNWNRLMNTETEKMIVLTRRGVPSSIRGEVWKVISGSAALKTKNPGVYFAMLEKPANPADQAAMLKDVSRTYPEHTHFQDSEGRGQRALLNVLTAYSNLDPAVGYCQGMSFVTATLVSQLNEEDAFWALVSLLKSHGLRSLYLPGLPLLKQFIFRLSSLLKAYLPDVSNHLSSIGMKHMFYSAEWFETLFAYNSNASITLRIWDCMFVEGPLYLCRVALAIMKLNHKQILSMTFEENMVYIKQAASTLNEKVLSTANRWRGMGPLLQKVDATFELYREEITSHQDVIIPKKEQPKISNDTSLPFLLGLPPSFDAADDDTRIQCDNIYDRM